MSTMPASRNSSAAAAAKPKHEVMGLSSANIQRRDSFLEGSAADSFETEIASYRLKRDSFASYKSAEEFEQELGEEGAGLGSSFKTLAKLHLKQGTTKESRAKDLDKMLQQQILTAAPVVGEAAAADDDDCEEFDTHAMRKP